MSWRKDRKWLAAVGSIDDCVLCGTYGTQVAHRNLGKGMGLKNPDCLTAALCVSCHTEIDNGSTLDKQARHRLMDEAIIRTLERLFKEGKVCAC